MDAFEPSVAGARRRGEGLGNARFLQADAAAFREAVGPGFDLVTSFDVVHDLTRPLETLKEIKAVLKEDGLFVMVDIRAETGEDKHGMLESMLESTLESMRRCGGVAKNLEHPMAPFLYTVSLMHCMPQGMNDGGPGLGALAGAREACEAQE